MDLPKTPSFGLDGKRAIVAGASSGIGLGCAVALADAGAIVTLAARRADRLSVIAEQFHAKGWRAETLPLDVADITATEAAIAAAEPFDILVNSAGLARHAPSIETTIEDFDAVMNVNLRGAYFLTRAVARKLIAAGRPGSLINVSSQMAHVGGLDRAVYCASKFAVEGFTKAMALEFAPHKIRVNTICPTFIRTPLAEQTLKIPARRRWIEEKIKLGRVGEIEDVMGAVVFLASAASSLVTGSSYLIDGGWTTD
jgi:NAD(P)-dependent dehydrogenase (short-subunit alcohol dehydrogenase family)